MDTLIISNNPLHTIQLIPIFNYLNLLSDFLFIENYLTEANQTRQIPIVNALYEYLEDYRGNQTMKIKLVRTLLKGSDLYGERDNENPDVIFVNAMFDYVITSLVFDKYGNIYGFLVDVFREAENFQIDYIMNRMKETLKNAIFRNEYGNSSILSNLSINRIYNDIILPHFPQAKTNVSLLSLDYIYAQAGSTFLQSGRINTTYYDDYKSYNLTDLDEDFLFDEYIIMGRIIENLLNRKEVHFLTYKAFALPALAYYVSTENESLKNVSTTSLIFDSVHWNAAYQNLSSHVQESLENIRKSLEIDYVYKMHMALLSFRNRAFFAKYVVEKDESCKRFTGEARERVIEAYVANVENFKCRYYDLPSLNQYWMIPQLDNIGANFKNYGLKIVQEALDESFIRDLKLRNVSVDILSPSSTVEINDFAQSEHRSYDVLKFEFNDNTTEYYAFIWKNYFVEFIKETENPQLFEHEIGKTIEKLEKDSYNLSLKTFNESIHDFWENLIKYKSYRLKTYLFNIDDESRVSEIWRTNWWKEFGLSLAPFYTCLANATHINYDGDNICSISNIKFMNNFKDDISSHMIHKNTQYLLSSLGTTIKAVFSRDSCDEISNEVTTVADDHSFPLKTETIWQEVLEKFSLEIEKPGLETTSISQKSMELLETIVGKLKEETGYKLTSVENMIRNIKKLKYNFIKSAGVVGSDNSRLMFVNTLNNKSDTGYGYKFIYLTAVRSETAQLRTVYDSGDEKLILRIRSYEKNIKTFDIINNQTLLPVFKHYIYEIYNQLRRNPDKFVFSGVSDNFGYTCDDIFGLWKNESYCSRQENYRRKFVVDEIRRVYDVNKRYCYHENFGTFRRYANLDDNSKISEMIKYCLRMKEIEEILTTQRPYIIHNVELLDKLRYSTNFDTHISQSDGNIKINSTYTYRERLKIEEETSLENIIKNFNEQNASNSITLEDYYATQNFATTGFTRITGDTNEAKRMKEALYKLGIRQSDDKPSEFDLKLYIIETKAADYIKKMSNKESITLKKFTIAFPDIVSAARYATHPPPGFGNIMYEMNFSKPYLRAKIFQFCEHNETKSILFPGTEFSVRIAYKSGYFAVMDIDGLGTIPVLKLDLKYKPNGIDEWYNEIMLEITRLNL